MKKKIICLISCFMLLIGSIFSLIPLNSSYAESYYYTADISTESSVVPDYAIEDIESFIIDNSLTLSFIFDSANSDGLQLGWWSSSESFSSYRFELIYFEFPHLTYYPFDSYFNDLWSFSIHALDPNGSINFWLSDSTSGTMYINADTGRYKFIFETDSLITYTDNSSKFVDMSVNNDYFNYFGTNSIFYDIYTGKTPDLSSIPVNDAYAKRFRPVEASTSFPISSFSWNIPLETIYNNSEMSCRFVPKGIDFKIYRPTSRINNSLVIYNYNYSTLAFSSFLEYSLSKGDNRFYVRYTDPIPNSYYIIFDSSELSNRIFDEYIDLDINLFRDVDDDFYNYYISTFIVEDGFVKFPLGFDFNFTYYTEPLVASNGSYNFDFDKPDYVEMKFTLSPFYIPVLEAVENIFIFLVFYCPVISDILSLLKLDLFIGGLISILNYILGLEIGQFLLSCISFIIFFAILKSFMPVVFSSRVEKSYEKTYIPFKTKSDKKFKKEQQKDLKSDNWSSPFNNKK